MRRIGDRWSLLIGILLLLSAGNLAANWGNSGRQALTFSFLVISLAVYALFEHLGWTRRFYLPELTIENTEKVSHPSDKASGLFVFSCVSLFFALYVELTGRAHSPLVSILCIPPLIAGLCYGGTAALAVSAIFSALYIAPNFLNGSLTPSNASFVLCFPFAAVLGTLLRKRIALSFKCTFNQVAELSTLMDVSTMLETAVDLETTINLLLINAERIVGADIAAVYLLDAGSPYLRLSAPTSNEKSPTFSQTLSIMALEAGEWRLTSDAILRMRRASGTIQDPWAYWPETISSDGMYSPLIGSEGVLGLLYVARTRSMQPFDLEDEEALRRFSGHVSMPLQKALFQENLSVLAFRDQMTDLSNYRYFEQRLTEDLVRAKRYQENVTILLLDIDYFKKFNDHFGHRAGDALLKHFGTVLKDCLRESDLPARYGGEEFIVICPGITRDEAHTVAERARIKLERTEFSLGESLLGEVTAARITVSIGTATFPCHAQDAGGLIRQADRALYEAKGRGRNVVITCDDIPTVDETIAARSLA